MGLERATSDIGVSSLYSRIDFRPLQFPITIDTCFRLQSVLEEMMCLQASVIDADLSSSNLMFMTCYVVMLNMIAVSSSEDSPIDFGSDGNDAGSWDSQLVLSIRRCLKIKSVNLC